MKHDALILAVLEGHVAAALQQISDRRILRLQTKIGTRESDFQQPSAKRTLSSNECRPARRATLLCHLGDRNEFLPTVHGFDEFFGNFYHLNAEEEPENLDYPKNPAFLGQAWAARCVQVQSYGHRESGAARSHVLVPAESMSVKIVDR